jgi:hypothetical protein
MDMQIVNKILFSLSLVILVAVSGSGQSKSKGKQKHPSAGLAELIQQNRFVFKAETASPMTGRFRMLTSDYDLRITKDSLVSYLPYFGRAYTANIGSNQSPLDFVSTNFTSNTEVNKKGRWIITLQPRDNDNVREMILDISPSGHASLTVTSNNRQPISFNGSIVTTMKR